MTWTPLALISALATRTHDQRHHPLDTAGLSVYVVRDGATMHELIKHVTVDNAGHLVIVTT